MANFNLTVKGTVKSDDDFRIQLELLQPSCTENDKIVTISSASKIKSNGQTVKAYVIPRNPSNFPGGSVDFSLYESNVPSNSYVKALIVINSVDGIDVYFGNSGATPELASEPNSLSYQIAVVTLRKIGSVLQNITNTDIVDRRPLNQINGAPVYYAAGDEIATEQFLVQIADSFVGLPNTLDNSIDFGTNRASVSQYSSPNLITAKYSTRTGSFSGTDVSLFSAPSFSVRPNCWIRVGEEYRRITNVASQTNFTVSSEFTGISWINESNAPQEPWVSVASDSTKFIAVSSTGKIISSEDGLDWDLAYNTSYNINQIIYTGSKFVAVANDGVILHSSDGDIWSEVVIGGNDFFSIAYNSDLDVYAVSSFEDIYIFSDSFTLSSTATIPQTLLQSSANTKYYTSDLIKNIVYGDGVYVIATDEFKEYETIGNTTITNLFLSYIWTSTDGATWTQITTPWKTSFNYSSALVNYVSYLNGNYIIGGNFGTYKSSDASSWSYAYTKSQAVSFGQGIYNFVDSNISFISEDLITFNESTISENNWKSIAFNDAVFCSVSTTGNYRTMIVDAGQTTFAIYEPIPTKDLYQEVGDETQGTRVIDNFSELVSSVLLDYDDSSTVDDGQFDSGDNNIIALISNDDEDEYVTFLRPFTKAGELTEILLPNPTQNLKITFLPFHYVGDGQVNLLGYSCFFIKDTEQYKGGIFNQALGFTNETSGLNMDIGLFGNKTLITFKEDFPNYIMGVNSSSPYGDLIVQEQGAEIPRRLVGVTDDSLPYYEEVSPNQIVLWGNLSSLTNRRMISVVRRYGTIDTSDQNSANIDIIKDKGAPILYGVSHLGCSNGDIVIFDGTDFVRALADNIANAEIVGMIFNISGSVGDVAISGKIENVISGLVPGSQYFLSQSNAGQIVTPRPISGVIVKVGFATANNIFVLDKAADSVDQNSINQSSAFIEEFKEKGSPVLYEVSQTGCSNGDIVVFNGTNFVRALADDIANADIVGIIFNISGSVGDVAISGKIEGVKTGLVAGSQYFLSQSSAGQIVTPKPSSGVVVKVGFAISSDILALDVREFFDLPQADAIIGSSTQVTNGQATHTSLTSAISDIPVDGKILILRGTFTGNIIVNKRCSIEGQGYGSNFSGNITVSSDYVTLKNVRFGGNLTVSGSGNFIKECFAASTSTISDTGIANLKEIIKE